MRFSATLLGLLRRFPFQASFSLFLQPSLLFGLVTLIGWHIEAGRGQWSPYGFVIVTVSRTKISARAQPLNFFIDNFVDALPPRECIYEKNALPVLRGPVFNDCCRQYVPFTDPGVHSRVLTHLLPPSHGIKLGRSSHYSRNNDLI